MGSLATYVITGALVGLCIPVFRWAAERGGAPNLQGDTVRYRPRPVTRIVGVLTLLLGLGVWFVGVSQALSGYFLNAFWCFLFGLPFWLLGAFVLLQRVTLHEDGLHFQRGLLRPLHIAWADMDHYEVNANFLIKVVFLRTRSRQNEAALSNLAFNTDDLLARLVSRTGIQQQPYRQKNWYGG